MTGLFVLLYPGRIGLAPFDGSRAPVSLQWRWTTETPHLMDEPALLANLIREMAGDDRPYALYIVLHPGLFRQIMFSHSSKNKRDMLRLRRSELETVLRQKEEALYTYDLIFHAPEGSFTSKERRLIYALSREWVTLMTNAFSAQKLKLCRLIPLDALAAECALRNWAPADRSISLCLTLDEGCVSAALLQDGHIVAMRTDPSGFSTALKLCAAEATAEQDACLQTIRRNGIVEAADTPEYADAADAVLRIIRQLAADAVKMLHAVFGSDARLDHVLLCGNLSRAAGVKSYFDTVLEANCDLADTATHCEHPESDAFTQNSDHFLLDAAADVKTDLLDEIRRERKGRRGSAAICTLLAAVCLTWMAAIPTATFLLQREHQQLEALLSEPEYALTVQLCAQRDALLQEKTALEAAVAALPQSQADTAAIIGELLQLSRPYGTVKSVRIDCASGVITTDFTAVDYDSLITWQRTLSNSSHFQFLELPGFTTSGASYTVSAKLMAAEFLTEVAR